ncbi:redoxin domain-containing protein [Marivirga sp. S37H4]|uniref:Redoxin domain-containing protein n=1 Tax=Marivirga aurantiaca TaxID=2802615 RepID=A0A934WXG8_9BACT|nr:redoxin domain-containing protein [Marivirga aurantiaca]MBK6264722.1 redoxin domain-containing protein [Marivirga aurantiaca]
MKTFTLSIIIVFSTLIISAQDIGSIQLKEVKSGQSVALGSKIGNKGAFIMFVDNTCPFVDSYNSRISSFSQKQTEKGYSILFVNPHEKNNPSTDNLASMQKFFSGKNWSGAYYSDPENKLVKLLGATKLPEVFFVQVSGNQLKVLYQGAIDDNPQNAAEVTKNYAENALSSFESGAKIQPAKMPAMGCRIKRF